MNIKEVKNILKYVAEVNDALLIRGEAGIGKSQVVKQFADENNYHFEDLRLGNQEIGDLIGIPVTYEDKTVWTKPIWLDRMLNTDKRCLLFLDELNRAQVDVKNAALQLVLDKAIHQHILPKNTLIVAAINPSDSDGNYQVDDLDTALLDRFLLIDAEADVKDWIEYGKEKGLSKVVLDFIAKNPKFLYNKDNEKYATPRSWEMVSKYVMNFKNIPSELQINILTGKLGASTAAKFKIFYDNFKNQVTVDDVLKVVKDKDFKGTTNDIKKLTDKLENIEKIELFNNIFEYAFKDIDTSKFNTHSEDALKKLLDEKIDTKTQNAMIAYLYALEFENLATVVYDIKPKGINYLATIRILDTKLTGKPSLFEKLISKK